MWQPRQGIFNIGPAWNTLPFEIKSLQVCNPLDVLGQQFGLNLRPEKRIMISRHLHILVALQTAPPSLSCMNHSQKPGFTRMVTLFWAFQVA